MSRDRNTNWIRPLALAALGFGAGAIFGGGRLVKIYDWQTEWNIDAPLAFVYKVLSTPEEQHKWWPSMKVHRVTPLPAVADGRTIEYRVLQAPSVARLAPPFKITAVTADIEKERRLRSVVSGDLVGVLETLFYSSTRRWHAHCLSLVCTGASSGAQCAGLCGCAHVQGQP